MVVLSHLGLANGTLTGSSEADYPNVAPFFLNETFPYNWYRRGISWSLPETLEQGIAMFQSNPRALGANEGSVDNFVPLDDALDPSKLNAQQLGCFIIQNF